MKSKIIVLKLVLLLGFLSCSKSIEYSEAFKNDTSGKYLIRPNELIEVYYEGNDLLLKWRGADKIKPVVTNENEFFVADMYKKLQFVQHPETKERFLSIVNDESDNITYDYKKVPSNYKTPRAYFLEGNYEKALEGFLEIQKQDPDNDYIKEYRLNRVGYKHIGKKQYNDAIAVFEMNTKLYPDSDNVYDSLAEAYLLSGDSLQAYNNYTKAFELNSGNKRAKRFVEAYKGK